MKDYEHITNPDGDWSVSVVVPEHSDETRDRAAKTIVYAHFEPWDERTEAEAVDLLAARAVAVSFTQWIFEWDDIEDAREVAERIPDEDLEVSS